MFVVPVALASILQAGVSDAVAATERRKLETLLADNGVAEPPALIEEASAAALAALERLAEATVAELSAEVPLLAQRVLVGAGRAHSAEVSLASRIMLLVSTEGLAVRGRPRGSWISTQHRWAPMAAWGAAREPVPAAEARTEVLRRYLRTFGPATEADAKWWTGWTLGHTRAALAAVGAVEVELDTGTAWALPDDLAPTPPVGPWVALLPSLDATPMGWTEREWYLGPHKPHLFDTRGNVGPSIWCDGRVVGAWAQRKDGTIVTELLDDVGTEAERAIAEHAAATEAWLGAVRFTPRFPTPLATALAAG